MSVTINGTTGVSAVQPGAVQQGDLDATVKLMQAKAWAYVSNAGVIQASYGFSGCVKNGTGDYTLSFSTPMADANYASVGSGFGNGGDGASSVFTTYTRTTTSVRVIMHRNDPNVTTAYDSAFSVVIFGN